MEGTGNRITILGRVDAELVEKRSRFISHIVPVTSEEEAAVFIDQMKREYRDATHNVSAYYINNGTYERCSDDGEPHGTSGFPVLTVLKNSGATDLCAVVTRYFGGTLLGTGGLVRAYTDVTKLAMDKAVFAEYAVFCRYSVRIDYRYYDRTVYSLEQMGIRPENCNYTENIELVVSCRKAAAEDMIAAIGDASARTAAVSFMDEEVRLAEIK